MRVIELTNLLMDCDGNGKVTAGIAPNKITGRRGIELIIRARNRDTVRIDLVKEVDGDGDGT